MASVGSMLKREREKMKVQISDISTATKIPEKYLRAIEKEDYSIFPGETYLVGFIRNYARELDLDPNEVVSLYKNTKLEKERASNVMSAASYVSREVKTEDDSVKIRRPISKEPEQDVPENRPQSNKSISADNLKKFISGAGQRKDFLSEALNFMKFFFRNQITMLITAGSILLIVILMFLIFFPQCKRTGKDNDKMASMQIIQLEQMSGVFDLNLNEYYRVRLGQNYYTMMGEMLNKPDDANNPQSVVKLLFHLNDSMLELSQSLKQDVDIDLDGIMDISLRVNSISQNSFNITIARLHDFATNVTTNRSSSTNAAAPAATLKSGGDPKKEAFTSVGFKKKIVFTAEVVRGEKCYVKAWTDSQEQEGKVFYVGQKIEYIAQDSLQLRVGNASALKVNINGVPYVLGKNSVNKTIKWKRDLLDENVYNLVISDWQ